MRTDNIDNLRVLRRRAQKNASAQRRREQTITKGRVFIPALYWEERADMLARRIEELQEQEKRT